MTYQGRVVFAGRYTSDIPFIGYGLSSKSDSKRALELSKNQVRVVPTLEPGHDALEVAKTRSNMYPAIDGFFHVPTQHPVMVSTIGTMTKRIEDLMAQGMPAGQALINTLESRTIFSSFALKQLSQHPICQNFLNRPVFLSY